MVSARPARGDTLLVAMLERSRFPLSALFELTRRCNLRCSHCYLDLEPGTDASPEMVVRALDELADAGTLFATFTGGEPSLHPRWLDLAAHARRRGFAVRLKTNATRLEDTEIGRIADLPVLSVDVSVYGTDPAVHDSVTGVIGSFEHTLSSVTRLRARGVNVSLRFPLLEITAAQLEGFMAFAGDLGCTFVVDLRISPSLDAERDTRAIAPAVATIHDALDMLHREILPPPDSTGRTPAENPWPCLRVQSGLYLRSDGEIRRCPLLPIPLGSALDGPIPDVWRASSARRKLLDASWSAPDRCVTCDLAWACTRCAAQAWLEHGGLEHPATIDCHLAAARAKGGVADPVPRCDTCGAAPGLSATRVRVECERSGHDGHTGRVE